MLVPDYQLPTILFYIYFAFVMNTAGQLNPTSTDFRYSGHKSLNFWLTL